MGHNQTLPIYSSQMCSFYQQMSQEPKNDTPSVQTLLNIQLLYLQEVYVTTKSFGKIVCYHTTYLKWLMGYRKIPLNF